MSGESNFYILSRLENKLTNKSALCIIEKEMESARKFISFCIVEEINNKNEQSFIIHSLKKQEIPKQDNYIKSLDISEIKFEFVDNGDNKIFIFLIDQNQNSNLIFVGDFYSPFYNISNIMFGVNGDLISLKKLNIKQFQRNSYPPLKNYIKFQDNVQSCNCCNII